MIPETAIEMKAIPKQETNNVMIICQQVENGKVCRYESKPFPYTGYLTREVCIAKLEGVIVQEDTRVSITDQFLILNEAKEVIALNSCTIDFGKEQAIIECKELRVALDKILQRVKLSDRQSRERSLVRTKLEEGVMWLGMDLKDLGTPNPYPNSRDTSNNIVDKTADGLKM